MSQKSVLLPILNHPTAHRPWLHLFLLLDYLNRFFHVRANGQKVDLQIKSKKLAGEGINTALGVQFEHTQAQPLTSLEIKNAVFTDLFFDQSNIVYVHVNGDTRSLMLNKETPIHELNF